MQWRVDLGLRLAGKGKVVTRGFKVNAPRCLADYNIRSTAALAVTKGQSLLALEQVRLQQDELRQPPRTKRRVKKKQVSGYKCSAP